MSLTSPSLNHSAVSSEAGKESCHFPIGVASLSESHPPPLPDRVLMRPLLLLQLPPREPPPGCWNRSSTDSNSIVAPGLRAKYNATCCTLRLLTLGAKSSRIVSKPTDIGVVD